MKKDTYQAPKSGPCLEILALLFPDSSRNTLKQWLRDGRIYLENRVVKKADQHIEEEANLSLKSKKKRVELEIEVLYEDRDLIVIEKPEGLLSVATAFEEEETVHGALKRRYYRQRVYPVHRLDRETSGVMVLAYSEKARVLLKKQFKEHTITREYRAIVEGKVEQKKGTWRSHLKEDAAYYVRSDHSGALAVTHYQVLKTTSDYTYLQLQLETGKKNQVRVHAAEAGFPIVGDQKYGAHTNPLKRLGLHAYLLEFFHPILKKKMVFKSPLPTKFNRVL